MEDGQLIERIAAELEIRNLISRVQHMVDMGTLDEYLDRRRERCEQYSQLGADASDEFVVTHLFPAQVVDSSDVRAQYHVVLALQMRPLAIEERDGRGHHGSLAGPR